MEEPPGRAAWRGELMGVRGLGSRPWLQSHSLGPGGVAGTFMDEAAGRADQAVNREQGGGLGDPGATWKGQRDNRKEAKR